MKQAVPTARNNAEESTGFRLNVFCEPESEVFLVPEERKKTSAITMTHKEIILTGNLYTTSNAKTSTGYRKVSMEIKTFKKVFIFLVQVGRGYLLLHQLSLRS